MNCNDVRKYFYAFLDDELDVEKNIEVLAHLDMCCECGQRMEKERLLQTRVRETVCKVRAPGYLVDNISRVAEEKPNFFILFVKNLISVRRLVPLAGVAAAIIVMVYFFAAPGNSEKDDILYLAESEYHRYMMQQPGMDIRSQDPETIVDYLRKQTSSNVVLPDIQDDMQLIGASSSEINGMNISQVFYMHDEAPVALMIVCDSGSLPEQQQDINFSGMKEVPVNGKVVYYDDKGYCGQCQILGWKEAGNQYVIVSKLKSDEMMRILEKA